ncbi:glycerophosphodiester phosphodiesterase [Alkalicoccus daliensis]|uniref:Glycerophosphoryl diester phosphodiesterase n=1 Tax=Alkalicoccus daliensis TaxID=745820 RepID=A0A1H0ER11_9BACI|nr:glycerophosphodiester phosphodiesterase family protein [Alkalicoccus daliensis]SDN84808.1 glycerophosphoryl diester phosphodiesterase [Alkalicoccus daliensis]
MHTEIFAHRGYSALYPENTMLAFREAAAAGAEGIELDVQLTKDEQFVVMHDATLDRTTEGSGRVREHTWKEVTRITASEDQKVPGLEEVLRWAQHQNITLNIELKHAPEDRNIAAKEIIRMLQALPQQKPPIISSFDHAVLPLLGEETFRMEKAVLTVGTLVDPVKYLEENFIAGYHFHHPMLTLEEIKYLSQAGVKLRPYTVNEENEIKKLIEAGCQAVITDEPALAVQIRNKFIKV